MVIFKEILILTRRELVSAFRETSVVLYSVLLPLLLYPFLLWLMVTALTYIDGQREQKTFHVAYDETLAQGTNAGFFRWLAGRDKIRLEAVDPKKKSVRFDALLRKSDSAAPNELVVDFVGDRPDSQSASQRLTELVAVYNESERREWLQEHDIDPEAAKPFEIQGLSTAASGEVGGYLLGALLPIGLLVMIALGGAYPAIDTTAGERERGTWETLQSCGPNLLSIVLSKYLFVTLVCCMSGVLNLFAMLVSIRSIIAPLLRENSQITFDVGPKTLLILLLGVVSVSMFVAAALLLCSVFARTFREGQALTTPMFMLIALPVLPLSDPSLEMSATLAWVPLVNLALVWRQALQGTFVPLHLLGTALTQGIMISLCLGLGARLLKSEALMSGSGIEPTARGILRVLKGGKRGS